MTESKKMTHYQVLSAIATAVHNSSEFTNSKRFNSYEEEAEKQHWLEWEEPISGLKCKFKDDKLILIFTEEITNPLKLTNYYTNKIEAKIDNIVSSIKQKYKEITNKTLSLKQIGDIYERAVPLSMVRQIRDYTVVFKIGGIDSYVDQYNKDVKELLKTALDKAEQMTVFKKR